MSKAIKRIDRASVHRICSGQVVLNLAMAVKELVENSVDAGAKNVCVRLVEYGSKLVEVTDDGEGVEEENFEGLCLKYHTSKLREFSDLEQVGTFGFRGEALSSLCALSEVVVSTCHRTASQGTQLKFDNHGNVTSKTVCARERGTTVSLHNLFSTLPVRRKEFTANLKREFNKMVNLLTGYCLSAPQVTIVCTNLLENGRKQTVLTSQGASSVRESISTLFGSKEVGKLLEIRQEFPSSDVLEEYSLSKLTPEDAEHIRVEGYVSSCAHGSGRSSADRQFFAINNRPCDLPKLSRVVNATYHMFNRHQYPFAYISVAMETDTIDINVTPDKRSILVHKEALLLAIVKSSLLTMFRAVAGTYEKQNSFSSQTKSPLSSFLSQSSTSPASSPAGTPTSPASKRARHESPSPRTMLPLSLKNFKFDRTGSALKGSPAASSTPSTACASERMFTTPSSSTREVVEESPMSAEFHVQENRPDSKEHCTYSLKTTTLAETNQSVTERQLNASKKTRRNIFPGMPGKTKPVSGVDALRAFQFKSRKSGGEDIAQNDVHGEDESQESVDDCAPFLLDDEPSINDDAAMMEEDNEDPLQCRLSQHHPQVVDKVDNIAEEDCEGLLDVDEPCDIARRERKLEFSFSHVVAALKSNDSKKADLDSYARRFIASIEPGANAAAEKELDREISKDKFAQMEVIGQFNLGFVVVRLEEDLFIIDQHAADEKYNFEMLQRDTVMQTQKLLLPQELELTAVNESVLLENMGVFETNGFGFMVDESRPMGRRVALVSIPVCGSSQFGKEDVNELIFMLSDNPHTMCRPSKVQQVFAMRACRKSIMVGTPLTAAIMKKIVGHLGELEHPWNCPHGRPTMRHLVSLATLP
ncbi:mismatch repair endonuclease PMS2-like [Ornithodoros turicata]|uniref:mismatch repair endonuclease PMS2-like n=1 Tax=Ornithodoros turicata TaxID=34597 RepID=UPI0031393E57